MVRGSLNQLHEILSRSENCCYHTDKELKLNSFLLKLCAEKLEQLTNDATKAIDSIEYLLRLS